MVVGSMKIVHCITGLTGDGAQRMLLRLSSAMRNQGVESVVINLGPEMPLAMEFRSNKIPVVSLGMRPRLADIHRGVGLLRAYIAQASPDIVQGWMYHGNMMVTLANAYSVAKAQTFWNVRRSLDDVRQLSRRTRLVISANRMLSWHPSGLIYCSIESGRQHETYGFCCKRSCVIENGFDSDRLVFSPTLRSSMRQELDCKDSDIVIGCIARYETAKGHRFLLRALSKVCAHRSDIKVVLVGRNVDAGNIELRDSLQALGLSSLVQLLGERVDVRAIYSALDIYCSPSINEGFPNVISEAMSMGLMCVVTDTGASQRLVGEAGISVPPGDVDALAEGLTKAIEMGPERRRSMGLRARRNIVENYSMASTVRRYMSVYGAVSR